jgi:hypothetical protein
MGLKHNFLIRKIVKENDEKKVEVWVARRQKREEQEENRRRKGCLLTPKFDSSKS